MKQFHHFYSEHKAIVFSSLVALVIIGIGAYRLQLDSINAGLGAVGAVTDGTGAVVTRGALSQRDSDRDGLLDWEEIVYGSNQLVADTDGDGTGDGIEVEKGRSPIVAGPNDELSFIAGPKFATSSTDVEGSMLDFYAEYLRNAGTQVREATFRDLVSKFNPSEFAPLFTIADLNVSPENTTEAAKSYANEFGRIIDKYPPGKFRDETEVLQAALQKKDSSMLKELQVASVAYREFASDLKKIRVPSEVAEVHLGIVNAYDVMGRACRAMIFFFDDPVRGSGAFSSYSTHRTNLMPAYALLIGYARQKNVSFTDNDPGKYFAWRSEWDATLAAMQAEFASSSAAVTPEYGDLITQ